MKKIYSILLAVGLGASAQATDVKLVVEKVNNQGVVPGNTYRVYAQLPEPNYSLHMVYGDAEHPLTIQSAAPFYQNELAGYSSASINENNFAYSPGMAYDSWITVGHSNSAGNGLWDIGVDFSNFNGGGRIETYNGAWFLIPTDVHCNQNQAGLVLIAQFTSTGEVSGKLNLQGWTAPQQAWKQTDLTFTTNDAKVFGCTDASAANYNPGATFDNGSCAGQASPTSISDLDANQTWTVFPNPLRGELIHIQLGNDLAANQNKVQLRIVDQSGKVVVDKFLGEAGSIKGNQVTLNQQLVAGTYNVVLTHGGKQESKTLVVVN
jgi:hypothetical protein